MLSQIERGSVNPTFARVWHLTKSLGIGVGELLGEVRSGIEKVKTYEHLKIHSIPVITSADGLCSTRILSPIRQALPFEWYEMILQPGGSLRANAHGNGAWEHQTVISGKLVIEIGDNEVVLGPGDTVRYSAEQPHGARNDTDEVARVLLVVVSLQELGALGF
jgi:mannose-6-phosphate isomerase-like protein (cupin superfamily)